MFIDDDASLVEAEVIGVGPAADGEQHVRAIGGIRVVGTTDVYRDVVALPLQANALSVEANVDAFLLQDLFHCCADVFVLALHQTRSHLDDGYLAAEPAKGLRELDADVASADND